MAHNCDVLVVHCMDFRLQKYLNDWCEQTFKSGNYDRVGVAGGVNDIYLTLKHVELSSRLHNIKKVVLVNHEDCGAYGAAGTYERHKADLAETEHKIQALFLHLVIEKYYLHLDGTFERVY